MAETYTTPPMLGAPEQQQGPLNATRLAYIAATAAGVLLAEKIGSSRWWNASETRVGFVGDEPQGDVPEAWLVTPGFNTRSTKEHAEAIAPALDTPVMDLELPHQKPSLRGIRAAVNDLSLIHI